MILHLQRSLHLALLSVTLILFSGCSQHRNAHNLLNDATRAINQGYNTSNGHLILQYDLNNSQSTCLHSNIYGKVINNSTINKSYILQTRQTTLSRKHIIKNSQNKLRIMHKLAYKLRGKYHLPLRLLSKDITNNSNSQKFYGARATSARLNAYVRQLDNIPIFNPEYKPQITSRFGMRIHPVLKKYKMHQGIDLVGRKNSAEIYASANGVVEFAAQQNNYGNLIIIKHAYGLKSKYAHLRQISVQVGEKVITGQKIGRQGKTGNVTNEHLHFEILLHDRTVDPMDFLAPNLNCY